MQGTAIKIGVDRAGVYLTWMVVQLMSLPISVGGHDA
jgi:hypothetical protein